MSTKLYCNNPLGHFLSRSAPQFRPEVRKVKRSLFGPIDHVANQKFLEEELEKIRTVQSEKWNFDFQKEIPLNIREGYEWKTVAPVNAPVKVKPAKRPLNDYEGEDLYALPDEIIRPIPKRLVPEKQEVTQVHQKSQPQRLITDFMPVKKRTSSDFSKKFTPVERPPKLPRLSELSS